MWLAILKLSNEIDRGPTKIFRIVWKVIVSKKIYVWKAVCFKKFVVFLISDNEHNVHVL